MSKEITQHSVNTKNIKREIVFADIGIIILGLLMVIFPADASKIICITGGILLGIWGLLKLVSYFAAVKNGPFSSFGLAQGATFVCVAIFLILAPQFVKPFLVAVLALVLMISAVMKIQYTVDFLRLKNKFWYIALIGAVVSIALGTVTLFNLNNTAKWVLLFVGISFLVTGAWDIACVALLSNASKTLTLDQKDSEDDASSKDRKRLKDKN
ncbi:MAG: DUF308 domain-containing protein [Ruminococcus sp.]|nr:DUF308 domain-containing protein [Ruminococcus sp.]